MKWAVAGVTALVLFADSTCTDTPSPNAGNDNPAPQGQQHRNPKLRLEVTWGWDKDNRTGIEYTVDDVWRSLFLSGSKTEGGVWVRDIDIWKKGATVKAERTHPGSLHCAIYTYENGRWVLQDGPYGYEWGIGPVRCSYFVIGERRDTA